MRDLSLDGGDGPAIDVMDRVDAHSQRAILLSRAMHRPVLCYHNAFRLSQRGLGRRGCPRVFS